MLNVAPLVNSTSRIHFPLFLYKFAHAFMPKLNSNGFFSKFYSVKLSNKLQMSAGIELFTCLALFITLVWHTESRAVTLDEAMQGITENIELPVFDRLVSQQ